MLREKFILSILIISFVSFTSCGQNKDGMKKKEIATVEQEKTKPRHSEPHPYGGWFCPDNLGGFPPMDIQELDKVPVVNGRLPTKEETRNGTSLIYFDTEEYPDARPLDMPLPRVARIHSNHNGMNELIVIIQAVVAGKDTVVGFRYPNGGNGTAWLDEVTFLTSKEVDNIGPSPFVYINSELSASKEKIWKAITQTSYAKKLGEQFDKNTFFVSEWTDASTAHLNFESDSLKANGIVTTTWGNLYLHIDYDYNGFHFSEKMLVIENPKDKTSQLQIVSGPYPKNFETQQGAWKGFLNDVKKKSEMK